MWATTGAADEGASGRGARWRTSQDDGRAAAASGNRLKWRAPRGEQPEGVDAAADAPDAGDDGEDATDAPPRSTLRPVERASHVAGQLDDVSGERPSRTTRGSRRSAALRGADHDDGASIHDAADAAARRAVGDSLDGEPIATRAVLLEPARLTIDDADLESAEDDPPPRSARPLYVSQPVDEGDADLPSRAEDVEADGQPPVAEETANQPAQLAPERQAPRVDETYSGTERPLDCDDECPSPTDPRLLADLMSISVDISDPLPGRDLATRPADRRDRCWRDANGDTFVARFGGYLDGVVTLILPDGTEWQVALDDLHPLDRRNLFDLPQECPVGDETFDGRAWLASVYHWKASSLCHKPLHFEEVALERYGHDWGPYLQPVISGAHFFGTVPLIPYHIGLEPCCECIYALGYYRPGSCAPYMIGPIPLSARAAVLQGAAVGGVIAVVP